MGIPLYFKTLYNDYPEIVVKNVNRESTNNFLFLDLNCAIHPCCRRVMANMDYTFYKHEIMEQKMIVEIISYIEKLVALAEPSLLYIAIDGVVPIAKMLQQRERRFKSAIEKKREREIRERCGMETDSIDSWDTNAISPGTEFMEKLTGELTNWINSKERKSLEGIKTILNSSKLPGEGEHKILNFIRANSKELQGNYIIYGLDADLIMLSMVSGVRDVFLLREEIEFKRGSSEASKDHFLYLDIDLLKERLAENIHGEYIKLDPLFRLTQENGNNITPESRVKGNFIDDYIVACFFFGNDFMPHTPSIDLRNKGHEQVLQAYIKTRHRLDRHLVSKAKMDTAFITYFLDLLGEAEAGVLRNLEKSRDKFNIRRFQFENDYEKEKGLLNNWPMIHREEEKSIAAGTRGWHTRYYSKCFGIDPNDQHERDAISRNYFEVLKWTFDYYFNGNITFYMGYNFNYAPTVRDMVAYLRKTNIELSSITFKRGILYNSLVQLMYILPETSKNLLPKGAREYQTKMDSPIRHYYPNGDIPLEPYFKRYYWQCSPVLPSIDIELIKNTVKGMKITTKEKSRFTRGKLLVK